METTSAASRVLAAQPAPTAGLAARALRAITRDRHGPGSWEAPNGPFPSATDVAIAFAIRSNTLRVETRAGRFGDYVALSGEAALIVDLVGSTAVSTPLASTKAKACAQKTPQKSRL
jgi:hypothetical protein